MRNITKKILISIGTILLVTLFIMEYLDTKSIVDAFFNISIETISDFGEIESILSISGILCIIIGILSKNDFNKEKTKDSKKLIMKYKILKWLGFLPFIAIVSIGVFSSIVGFSFMFSTSYGIAAFFESILIISLFIWPLYIIGIVLIIYSKKKITNLNS